MSAITFKTNTAANAKTGNGLKDMIKNYFHRSQNPILPGFYAAGGEIPDLHTLRAMKMLEQEGVA